MMIVACAPAFAQTAATRLPISLIPGTAALNFSPPPFNAAAPSSIMAAPVAALAAALPKGVPAAALASGEAAGGAAAAETFREFFDEAGHQAADDAAAQEFLSKFGPIDRGLSTPAPRVFSGDNPSTAHMVLRGKEKFIASLPGGKLPEPSQSADVIVIGGGSAGLITTYGLASRNVLLLEQAPRFGGNAKAEAWNGLESEIGASFISIPEKGSEMDAFLNELGIAKNFTVHPPGANPVVIDGKRHLDLWENGTNPQNKTQFNKLGKHLEDMAAGRNGLIFPEIPALNPNMREYVDALDRISLRAYLEKVVGGPLDQDLERFVEYTAWSDNAATIDELSAAAGLNFLAADHAGVASFPGGNSFIMEALLKKILQKVPRENLRPSSVVFDVKVVEGGVNVAYLDGQGKVFVARGKTAVFAGPKFVAQHVIDDLEPERAAVIDGLRYRSYLVGTVLVNKPLKEADRFYDMQFSDRSIRSGGTQAASEKQGATDVVGAFDDSKTVLTLFRPLPYDGARSKILKPDAYEKIRKEFEAQINSVVLPMLKLSPQDVADIRVTRWGHPIPLSETGNYAEGKVDILRKPFKDRVFFVNQDNWMLPALETILTEARQQLKSLQKLLGAELRH